MKVTYPGPVAAVEIAATGDVVRVGESVEVPDDVGAQLVEQGWTAGDTPKPKKPTPTINEPADAGDTTEGS